MDLKKLKQAEKEFFNRYPGGFANPEMIAIRKKHKLEKMIELAQDGFAKRNFKLQDLVIENMIKVITRSSLISVLEKPKFRDFARALPSDSRKTLTSGLQKLLYGNHAESPEKWTAGEVVANDYLSGVLSSPGGSVPKTDHRERH